MSKSPQVVDIAARNAKLWNQFCRSRLAAAVRRGDVKCLYEVVGSFAQFLSGDSEYKSEPSSEWARRVELAFRRRDRHLADSLVEEFFGLEPDQEARHLAELSRLPEAEKLRLPISELQLSLRSQNVLEGNGVLTIGVLLLQKPEWLDRWSGCGETTKQEIYTALERIGFRRSN